ncbi:MAG TPA: phosphoribosylformylglycinamidine synthase subunit PurS [Peptococcaceae bacterium]|nr:MAG: Phosphoribosylformylglycinamidine synthase subunit PurS [Clostridia bacterium 41_269]HBT20752.1 phosphoribosylformylglycinamidine synthase subunit PurS [Peptococcaceae bacterium]
MFLAKIYVTLKEEVLDPQGNAVGKALHAMNYKEVQSVRIGKYMELYIEGEDAETVGKRVDEMCSRLLANPVIEQYSYELVEVET